MPMNVWQNATLAIVDRLARFGWRRDTEARDVTRDGVKRLDVRLRDIGQPIRELSGGNQQKVVLSKWLATKPKVMLLDEPTRGIDIGAKAEVHRLIAELAAAGMAVLMISSDLPEVLAMSDRILVMREGRIVAEFSRQEATAERVIAAAAGQVMRA
jgi:ABC-type sugar transport system ATPase subunit